MMDEKTFKRLWRKDRALYVRDPENNYNQVKIASTFNFMSGTRGIYFPHENKVYVAITVDEYLKLKGLE